MRRASMRIWKESPRGKNWAWPEGHWAKKGKSWGKHPCKVDPNEKKCAFSKTLVRIPFFLFLGRDSQCHQSRYHHSPSHLFHFQKCSAATNNGSCTDRKCIQLERRKPRLICHPANANTMQTFVCGCHADVVPTYTLNKRLHAMSNR